MITEPIMLDKTGKAIVNAILSTGAQTSDLKELKEKTQDLQNQINNLPEGVKVDEVVKARSSHTGKTYPEIKDRLDEENSVLTKNVDGIISNSNSIYKDYGAWEQGAMSYTTGADSASDTAVRRDYQFAKAGQKFITEDRSVRIFIYDKYKHFISDQPNVTDYTFEEDCYFRVLAFKTSSETIDDVKAIMSSKSYFLRETELQKEVSELKTELSKKIEVPNGVTDKIMIIGETGSIEHLDESLIFDKIKTGSRDVIIDEDVFNTINESKASEKITVKGNSEVTLSFESVNNDGQSGSYKLNILEYSNGEIINTLSEVKFERVGTSFDPTSSLISGMFPNGGRFSFTTNPNTDSISVFYTGIQMVERIKMPMLTTTQKVGIYSRSVKANTETENLILDVANNTDFVKDYGAWEKGAMSYTTGADSASDTAIRRDYQFAKAGQKFITEDRAIRIFIYDKYKHFISDQPNVTDYTFEEDCYFRVLAFKTPSETIDDVKAIMETKSYLINSSVIKKELESLRTDAGKKIDIASHAPNSFLISNEFGNVEDVPDTDIFTRVPSGTKTIEINADALNYINKEKSSDNLHVHGDCKLTISFDRVDNDGQSGAYKLNILEYSNGEIINTLSEVKFERVGTSFDPTSSLISGAFPNGGRFSFTTNPNTDSISVFYTGIQDLIRNFFPILKLSAIVDKYSYSINEFGGTEIASYNLIDISKSTSRENTYLGKDSDGNDLVGWYLGKVGGVATGVSGSGLDSSSAAIPVHGGKYYKSGNTCLNVFDENDCRINITYEMTPGVVDIPESAVYARVSFVSERTDTFFCRGNYAHPFDKYAEFKEGLSIEEHKQLIETLVENGRNEPYHISYMREIAMLANQHSTPTGHTFLALVDTHVTGKNDYFVALAAEMTKYVPCSYISYAGDSYDGMTDKNNELYLLTKIAKYLNNANCITLYAKGNHELNAGTQTQVDGYPPEDFILNSEISSRLVKFHSSKIKGNLNDIYYYYDDEVTKVRTIVINAINRDETISDGTRPDMKKGSAKMGINQLNWYANIALNLSDKDNPSEWGVITIGHRCDMSMLNSIIDAFKGGISKTIYGTDAQTNVQVTVDYSNQGAGNYIASFMGDDHFDALTVKDNENGKHVIITTLNASEGLDNADKAKSDNSILMPPRKPYRSENETAFDIVSVDKENHTISMTRYGARSYAYNATSGEFDILVNRTRIVNYLTGEYTQLI